MKINEAISRLRVILKNGIASDDSILSNRFVYSILRTLRSKVIGQRLDSFSYLSPFYYSVISCLPLELGKFNDCPCFTNDCYILRSKYKLPRIMSGRSKMAIKSVTTINGKIISESSPTKEEYKKYTRTKKEELSYFIHNDYLFVKGSTTLKVVSVTAIVDNPLDLSVIIAVDCDGNPLPITCYNPANDEFPIDERLFDDIESMGLEKLMKTMIKLPEDNENNARNNQVANDLE